MGHDSVLLPIYLPLSAKNQNSQNIPVFYGAVNIYLKQRYHIFRHMPGWFHRLLDARPVLRYAAKKAGSTRASGLEEMTISMLRGTEGYQNEELLQLVNYLKHHEKPDLVHLSNALLLGLAETIRNELKIPVICSLQDEDVWVDAMKPAYRGKIWDLMAEKGKDIDAFIAVSGFYGDLMKSKMKIAADKMHIVHIGVNPEIYRVNQPVLDPPVIGYLSRLCEENGLEILVDAFIELKDHSAFANTKLRLSGGKTGDDNSFIRRQILKLKRKGYHHDVEWIGDFSPDALPEFFKGLTVLSVPVLKGEAFGLYQIESLASGIPVVQPALGAFPEIVNATGGGLVYSPNSPKPLADALEGLFSRPEKLQQLSKNGRTAIMNAFNNVSITNRMIHVYETVLKKS
jgi:glycosyltransferase involved in cell wall biosynthesis